MKRRFFLGLAANYPGDEIFAHTFMVGRKEDLTDLKSFLLKRYGGEKAILTKNGRSALTLALQAYFEPGDQILVNGFTCYAVYEAVKAAKLEPVFVDISLNDLNFTTTTLGAAFETNSAIRDTTKETESTAEKTNPTTNMIKGIIIQNTLGNPVDIVAIEKFAAEHGLTIIEDLAHSAGVKYIDGREVGTVGAATVLSFGKEKSIDTVAGGALVLRQPCKNTIEAPNKLPRLRDHLRARLYPFFGLVCRKLTTIHLGGVLMKILLKIHLVERSADSKLDLKRRLSKFEAKRALMQIKGLSRAGEKPLRNFYLVHDRDKLLAELKEAGYYFDGFWYEKPVSPVRYYKKVHFPEKDCRNAVYAAEHIINIPKYYRKKNLEPAIKIIEKYLEEKV